MLDGPAMTLFPKHVIKAASQIGTNDLENDLMGETDDENGDYEVPSPRS